jgi:nitrate ABC transporter ATP-binding subunit
MSLLEIWKLTKSFDGPDGSTPVVDGFDLEVAEGEFVSIVGHSGCGKSTVLSMLAGLLPPTGGGIVLDGKEVTGPGVDRGVVFQAPCLLPWLDALDNVRLAVDSALRGSPLSGRIERAGRCLSMVGLGDSLRRKPAELSQGMRQRVGIARALGLDPRLLLLDEPFGMLDSLTRWELEEILVALCEKERKTAIMVTHDVDEALFLSDRVVLMTSGPAARVGEIVEVPFQRPRERRAVLEDPDYYVLRERLIGFLEREGQHRAADQATASC